MKTTEVVGVGGGVPARVFTATLLLAFEMFPAASNAFMDKV